MNGDGYPDVIVACELSHLIYFENPGPAGRVERWKRVIPAPTLDRGSYIRVFLADFDADGVPEVVAANKGGQNPPRATPPRSTPCRGSRCPTTRSTATPGSSTSWPASSSPSTRSPSTSTATATSTSSAARAWNAASSGSRNVTDGAGIAFREHRIEITPEAVVTGFNMEFVDLSGDGRVDIAIRDERNGLSWLEQPADFADAWRLHPIGGLMPDRLVGFVLTDIDDDGRLDAFSGAYSQDPRDVDATGLSPSHRAGRLSWFEQPEDPTGAWIRHDVSRRVRGMFDKFLVRDMDGDGDVDLIGTRGNSVPYDGVFWLEQVRTADPVPAFSQARDKESRQLPLPE